MKQKTVKISEIQGNPINPREIKADKFKKLVKSIQDFPEMLDLRPIVVNSEMVVLGGNMRLKAAAKAGLKELKITIADKLSPEQEREFIIKDNASFGDWDWDALANEWDAENLIDWGLDVPLVEEEETEVEQEIEFSEYLGEEHNYVVLYFENDVDWLSAKTHFGLKSVHSKRANGKPWSKGIGRVLNGAEYLDKIKGELND